MEYLNMECKGKSFGQEKDWMELFDELEESKGKSIQVNKGSLVGTRGLVGKRSDCSFPEFPP